MRFPLPKIFQPAFILSVLAGSVFFLSCNNASNTAQNAGAKDTVAHQALSPDSMQREAELSFIDACVESSKTASNASLTDAKAYAHCKCMMEGIKQKYGNTDSITIATMQKDTAAMAQILQRCK